MFMSAIEDAAALVPWAEANQVAMLDEKTSMVVLHALGGPVPEDCAVGVPLLRFATEGVPAMPLLDAMLEDPLPRHDSQSCDRCGNDKRSINDRLWIPAGASVVVVALCWSCKACVFERPGKRSSLVWS
ncbi:hypothetical protein [Nocardioides sp.]|uniref:hypothetical protein n=1 Tax=Nocardioides sp. TaxID=35761 RepID=UPI00260D04C1|nr:hypothetical protein [Nocardioides sp.]MCW2738883.1 hypothetical protein [Nocardioides sp.]